MRRAQRLYADHPPEPDLPFALFALDATLIELSLALFPWARWQSSHAAVKLNVLLDLTTDIPVFASLHEGSRHEVAALDDIPIHPDSFYVIDRGYMDFQRLHRLHAAKAFFVIRSKCNLRFYVVESRKVDKTSGVRCDQTIRLNFRKSREHYPETLRRIRYFDAESGLSLVFLTNAFHPPALTIAAIYRRRWQIELFLRWIKQHLRLRGFFSNDPNGVRVHVWTAICAYLLVAIAKKENALPQSLHQVLQVVSLSCLEKVPLVELFATHDTTNEPFDIPIQLEINGF